MKNEILKSWQKNAAEWVRVIEENQIRSRLFTNNAIISTLADIKAVKILDMGCGEGWLSRHMTSMGKKTVGIDAISMLLDTARSKGLETYYQMSYEEIAEGRPIPEAPFDAVVFNFSIYQKELLYSLLKEVNKILTNGGFTIIQTLHPFYLVQSGLDYRGQWINDSWKGLPGNFTEGHSWYARTFADWINVFNECNLAICELKEIKNEKLEPISVIFKIEKRK